MELALEIDNAKFGAMEFGIEDMFLRWPKATPMKVKKKLAGALEEAVAAGVKMFLLPDRITGFSSTVLFERELIVLLRDLLKQAGSCTTFRLSFSSCLVLSPCYKCTLLACEFLPGFS